MSKKNNIDDLDIFFSYVSKAVIFIPIIIVVLSLIFKFNSPKNSLSTIQASPTPAPFKFDLNGPYHCIYKNNNQKFEAFIKNKNILVILTQNGKSIKYSLTPYVSMIEGFMNQDLSSFQPIASRYNINIKEAINSCKKEAFNESVFK